MAEQSKKASRQSGGFGMGMIVGVLVGLGLALIVALYVAKVPVPFINKVPSRTAEQDAAEAEKNRNWDPNAQLAGKAGIKAASAASTPMQAKAASQADNVARAASAASAKPDAASAQAKAKDPAAILAGKDDAGTSAKPADSKAGDLFFVQAGAFSQADEAEAQKAKLAMGGFSAKVTEREQTGRMIYRVRLGPFASREEAEAAQAKLNATGEKAVLVSVSR